MSDEASTMSDQASAKPQGETPLAGNKDSAATPSGPKGDNPGTAGPGKTEVKSDTPENRAGHVNPSPEDVNATPGTLSEK